jgi:hypothetical protein
MLLETGAFLRINGQRRGLASGMSQAVMNLITREAVELHFEGATYGPVAHTEALGVLLHFLSPSSVRCIANGSKFARAMAELLSAAHGISAEIEAGDDEVAVQAWLRSAWRAVPAERRVEFGRRCERHGVSPAMSAAH